MTRQDEQNQKKKIDSENLRENFKSFKRSSHGNVLVYSDIITYLHIVVSSWVFL
jgi:hypothetical protein